MTIDAIKEVRAATPFKPFRIETRQTMRLFDSHNHLQDERLAPRLDEIVTAARAEGVVHMVVNGSAESDWPEVLLLSHAFLDRLTGEDGFNSEGRVASRKGVPAPELAPSTIPGPAARGRRGQRTGE